MTASILYCGDTNLDGAASYLAGLMTHFGWSFEYVPSDVKVTREQLAQPRLLILSDYPAKQFDADLQQIALNQIQDGMGLLMIGGWESFHGAGGDWDTAPLAQAIPVEIGQSDDRVNFDQPALLHPVAWNHELWDLPWSSRPPTVGGINKFRARANCEVRMSITSFHPKYDDSAKTIQWSAENESYPALVTGQHGAGRTAAFASDVAPHWVGGFVDWGSSRVTAQAPGAVAIEVGSDYARFWKQLLAWTGKFA